MFRRMFVLVSLTLVLMAPCAVHAQEAAQKQPAGQPSATTTADLRSSGRYNFLDIYRSSGRIVLPDVTVLRLPGANYTEVSVSGGYAVIADDHWYLLPELGVAFGSNGKRYALTNLAVAWNDGRWSASAFVSAGFRLNRHTPGKFLVDPIDAEYRLGKHWGAGLSLTAVDVGGSWETKLGPMVRYHPTDRSFVELRLAKVHPGDFIEAQVRLNTTW